MSKPLNKKEILASSSSWVSILLNLFPGLGTGYIYQRRWIPYFLTVGIVTIWISSGIYLQNHNYPKKEDTLIGLGGLILIALITSIESYFAHKKASDLIEENK